MRIAAIKALFSLKVVLSLYSLLSLLATLITYNLEILVDLVNSLL